MSIHLENRPSRMQPGCQNSSSDSIRGLSLIVQICLVQNRHNMTDIIIGAETVPRRDTFWHFSSTKLHFRGQRDASRQRPLHRHTIELDTEQQRDACSHQRAGVGWWSDLIFSIFQNCGAFYSNCRLNKSNVKNVFLRVATHPHLL